MKMIDPITVQPFMVSGSTVPIESDPAWPRWVETQAYAVGDQVYLAGIRRRYRCVTANSGQNPSTDASETYWIDAGPVERFRVFDGNVAEGVTATERIAYTITPNVLIDSIYLAGVQGIVTVRVFASDDTPLLTRSFSQVDTSSIQNMTSLFSFHPVFRAEAIATDLNVPIGGYIRVNILGAQCALGEIILGRSYTIGVTEQEPELSKRSQSDVTRDIDNVATIITRQSISTASFRVWVDVGKEAEIMAVLDSSETRPRVFYTGDNHGDKGTTILGLVRSHSVQPRGHHLSPAQITIWSVNGWQYPQ